ncbi:hypothetical protein B0H14DRAFT_3175492 [Mycena olivaceomarginata]|nr:hypothetical protein B0H14DRAFT_3175492 [Mycena olivaceomarginata]
MKKIDLEGQMEDQATSTRLAVTPDQPCGGNDGLAATEEEKSTLSTASARPPDSNETFERPNHSVNPMIFFKKKKLTSGMGCQVSVIAGSDGDQQENGGGQTNGSGRCPRSWARHKTGWLEWKRIEIWLIGVRYKIGVFTRAAQSAELSPAQQDRREEVQRVVDREYPLEHVDEAVEQRAPAGCQVRVQHRGRAVVRGLGRRCASSAAALMRLASPGAMILSSALRSMPCSWTAMWFMPTPSVESTRVCRHEGGCAEASRGGGGQDEDGSAWAEGMAAVWTWIGTGAQRGRNGTGMPNRGQWRDGCGCATARTLGSRHVDAGGDAGRGSGQRGDGTGPARGVEAAPGGDGRGGADTGGGTGGGRSGHSSWARMRKVSGGEAVS